MQETIHYITRELKDLYPPGEIRQFVRLILHALRGYSLTEMIVKSGELFSAGERSRVSNIVARLKMQEPIQHILEQTLFHGLDLKVNPAVLIPRPETEELVDWIIREYSHPPLRILDIGTGSGCIALALKKAFNTPLTEACDISEKALTLAQENASENHLDIRFFKADILQWEKCTQWNSYDLIVSNPPYVTLKEKKLMPANVTDFEPWSALFVPDEEPLLFYRHIAVFANRHLQNNGSLFLEINEKAGSEIRELLMQNGFNTPEIRNDMQGKPRMVKAVRNY